MLDRLRIADDQRDLEPTINSSESTEHRVARLEGALHDVANALTVVLGWLDAAKEQAPQGTSIARTIRLAHSRAMHGKTIALEAMGHSELSSEQQMVCKALVRESMMGLVLQAKRSGVRLKVALDRNAGLVHVTAPSRALQILTNLLMNAVAFTPRGARVTLQVGLRDPTTMRFVVSDEGPGIPPSRGAQGFDGFESTRTGGTGIGLRHAHQIAHEHGGSLSLLHPGPGAIFELCWPTYLTADRPSEQTENSCSMRRAVATLDGMRVLLLEDDAAVSTMLTTALEARNALVDAVFDHEGMTTMLANNDYDAALLDLSPIDSDAGTTAIGMPIGRSNPKLVLISGAASRPHPAILERMAAWIRKPFEVDEVVAALVDVEHRPDEHGRNQQDVP